MKNKILLGIKRIPNLFKGFNLYDNPEKIKLIDKTFSLIDKSKYSFIELGGVWKVNGAYTKYTCSNYSIEKGYLIDTNFNSKTTKSIQNYPQIKMIHNDFGNKKLIKSLDKVDVIYFFDILLHQANPDWHEILLMYSAKARYFVIYNQQLITSHKSIRLTDLPIKEYRKVAPDRKDNFYEYVYTLANEINQEYG